MRNTSTTEEVGTAQLLQWRCCTLWAGQPRNHVWFPPGARDISFLQRIQTGCYTISTRGTLTGDKETEVQRWPSRTSSAKVNNECGNIYTPPYAFMAFTSIFYSTSSSDLVQTSSDSFRKLVKSSMCLGKMPQKCGVHHHHVQEGLRLIPVPCIFKMKLVTPSLPRSSYVSSSFWFIL